MSQIMSDIEVNDIFDDLFIENQRLLNELLVTKKCLKVLSEIRVFIKLLFAKYGLSFEPKDSNHYHRVLAEEVDKVLDRRETTGDRDNDQNFTTSLLSYWTQIFGDLFPESCYQGFENLIINFNIVLASIINIYLLKIKNFISKNDIIQ